MKTSSPSTEPFVPQHAGLPELRDAAAGCRGCPLHENATQTVFGAGRPDARLVLVGEQPGDQEDRKGAPFVGPAGRLLDRALADAEIDRELAYVTNAVKHFKFSRSEGGKRRIHQKPTTMEMAACRPWLIAELQIIEPDVIIALGATAGQALLGPSFRVTKERGVPLPCPPYELLGTRDAAKAAEEAVADGHGGGAGSGGAGGGEGTSEAMILATIHPSAVLRAEDRDAMYAGLVADLTVAARFIS